MPQVILRYVLDTKVNKQSHQLGVDIVVLLSESLLLKQSQLNNSVKIFGRRLPVARGKKLCLCNAKVIIFCNLITNTDKVFIKKIGGGTVADRRGTACRPLSDEIFGQKGQFFGFYPYLCHVIND